MLARLGSAIANDARPRVHLATVAEPEPPAATLRLRGLADGAIVVRREPFDSEPPPGTLRVDVTSRATLSHVEAAAPTPAPAQRDLLLVSMPFADLRHPSIGLSLLKRTVPEVSTEVVYCTYPFAERIGAAFYDWISSGHPDQPCLVGEWLFREALHGERDDDADQRYVDEVLRHPRHRHEITDGVIRNLFAMRRQVEPFLDATADRILAAEPKIVGFTSVFQQHVASLALARRLAARAPDLRIVFGGANCEGEMGVETLRAFRCVDAVVSGEGERVFPELVARWLDGRSIDDLQGVVTQRTAGGDRPRPNAPRVLEMDALPFAEFDDLFATFERSSIDDGYAPRLLFETSRGCWWGEKHHCTFCGLNGSSMTFRSKSPQRALDELVHLTESYPGSKVAVVDNIMDIDYLRTLLPTLAERRLGVELFYEMKSNLKKDHLRLMRDAGLTEFQPGIESFSSEVLRLMEKGVSGLQNLQLLKWSRELGVRPYWNLLWGFPGEPPEAYREMAELVPWLTHLQPPVKAGPFRLDRFSPNFTRSEELGLDAVRPYPAYRHLYPRANGNLAKLAYYFEYGYAEPRDVAAYTAGLDQQLTEWQDVHEESDLFMLDKDGTLFVFDHRPAARRRADTLTGLERWLLLACDEVRTLDALAVSAARQLGRGVDGRDVRGAADRLCDLGWLVVDGGQALCLAVDARSAAESGR